MIFKPWDTDCVCVPFRVWEGKTKDLSAFERGMVVGAGTPVWVCQELQRCWVFLHTQDVSRMVYQEWSTTQMTSSQLDTTVGSIGVSMGQHVCGILSIPLSPCPGQFRLFWMWKGVQLHIRKVCLMFGTVYSVYMALSGPSQPSAIQSVPITRSVSQMAPYSLHSAEPYGPWSKVVHYKGNGVPFGTPPRLHLSHSHI